MEVALGMHCAMGQASAHFGGVPSAAQQLGLASGLLVEELVEPANLPHQRVFGFFDMPHTREPLTPISLVMHCLSAAEDSLRACLQAKWPEQNDRS